ncbi:MAG: hypothetical protein M3R55_04470 [Acidobacteriota bacterium]|nr:hypothetical protein [Acidobacteriota bacterium]
MNSFVRLRGRLAALAIVVTGAAAVAAGLQAQGAGASPSPFSAVSYRGIGPTAQGGRFVEYAVVEATPQIFYAATASGGLWKTENHGLTFTSIFDNQPVVSIGAVALFQPNPSIVWVGTGEANNSRSSYWGDGVYKSTDAGMTWTNVGLKDSQHIGRIVLHPTDPNIAYVAALGHLYSSNDERGLYKTADGGKSWTRSLEVTSEGKKVGVVDVAMDPKNPNILFAAAYDKVREPWTFVEGGPGSALYRSADAGRTWAKVGGGLPGGMLGRIGVAISRQDSLTVYATVENVNAKGVSETDRRKQLLDGKETPQAASIGNEVYRSDDGGKTWQNVSGPGVGEGPPYYYAQVRVDPSDKRHVYVLGVGVHHSNEGGGTWTRPFNFGGDNHALWINPRDSKHMILGYDHGMGVTFDAGKTWYHPDDMPLAQYYAIGLDMEQPYNVYGGLQDNGSWRGPSTKKGGRPINFEDWFVVGGGDGMYNVVDQRDSRWLYNESQFAGGLQRVDQVTGERRSLRYAGPDANTLRYNWNAPIVVSPHDSNTVYLGASRVLRSTFRGENWTLISPDLTLNAEKHRNGRGNIQYGTITTLDESPIVPGLLWAGTDDGNVQVRRDANAQWTNLRDRIPSHPGYWVSRVVASSHNPAVAYVTMTGYRNDDFKPFAWKTSDYGQTWSSIAGNLPNEPINVIREDRRNPTLLIAGTDLGVHATLDGGRSWSSLLGNMPRQPVHDIAIHPRENELVVGTHGRGIFIADITHLQEMTSATMSADAHLFDVRPAVQWQFMGLERASSSQNYNGPSRAAGVHVNYWLKSVPAGDVKLRVYEGTRLVRELTGTKNAGLNTVVWDLSRIVRERTEAEKAAARQAGARGRGGFGGPATSLDHILGAGAPGSYRVVLSVGGREIEKTAIVIAETPR